MSDEPDDEEVPDMPEDYASEWTESEFWQPIEEVEDA